MTKIYPEPQLLLYCARTEVNSACAKSIKRLVNDGLDWEVLLRLAAQHRVVPLLYQALNKTCSDGVPPEIMGRLRVAFHANARRNLFLTKALIKLLNHFQTAGIKAVPYKGPIVAATIYGDLTLRQFSDLDILVHPDNVLVAKETLLAQGYHPQDDLTPAEEINLLRNRRAQSFLSEDGKIGLDLQWGISVLPYYAFPIETDAFWRRLEPTSLAGASVKNMPMGDVLHILCVHGSRHCWERLAWICDIAELIRHYPTLDWLKIIAEARLQGNERMLLLGLLLASDLLGATLPEGVWLEVQTDPIAKSLATEVRQRFLGNLGPPAGFNHDLFRIRMRERWRDKSTYLLDRLPDLLRSVFVPTPADRSTIVLPTILSFLYYFIRPLRLFNHYLIQPILRKLRLK